MTTLPDSQEQGKASEHTPGPWKKAGKDVVSADAEFICLGVGDKECARANARLIAAAPELLALAKRAANERGWHATVSPNCTCLPCEAGRAVAQVEGGGA